MGERQQLSGVVSEKSDPRSCHDFHRANLGCSANFEERLDDLAKRTQTGRGHSTDVLQITPKSGESYHRPAAAKVTLSPLQPSDGMVLVIGPRLDGHSAICLVIQTHPPVAISSPSIPSAYAGAGLGRNSSTRHSISRNRFRGAATSANRGQLERDVAASPGRQGS